METLIKIRERTGFDAASVVVAALIITLIVWFVTMLVRG